MIPTISVKVLTIALEELGSGGLPEPTCVIANEFECPICADTIQDTVEVPDDNLCTCPMCGQAFFVRRRP